MHEQNHEHLKVWDDKIQALETEIDQECQRSSCIESDLCAAIEVRERCNDKFSHLEMSDIGTSTTTSLPKENMEG